MKILKKYWIFMLIPLILIVFVGGYSYFKITNKDPLIKNNIDENSQNDGSLVNNDVFGELEADSVYEDLKVDSENKGYITDELIAHSIKIIINGMARSDGIVKILVKKISTTNVVLDFEWTNDSKNVSVSKQYNIFIRN